MTFLCRYDACINSLLKRRVYVQGSSFTKGGMMNQSIASRFGQNIHSLPFVKGELERVFESKNYNLHNINQWKTLILDDLSSNM